MNMPNWKDAAVIMLVIGTIILLVTLGPRACTRAEEDPNTLSNRVTWDAATTYEDGSAITNPVRYWLYQNDVSIATVNGTEYTVPDLLFDVEYCYKLKTVVSEPTGDSQSSFSEPACATATEDTPPPPPGGGEPGDPDAPNNINVTVTISLSP